ncbi:uncharacterized protein LOC108471577 [Gossypium arboreum]|uniref:Uncharacterized protein n=1 Tax=Gossypium arboreum TaxID=29729 RepID=A0ABR0R3W3_GOSAR|nr:uncharacterized protein LOC108471577 [Gossypium arboreum]KAK5846296.1 hypothetical protein PVK06_002579 [Gossypium arboreum]
MEVRGVSEDNQVSHPSPSTSNEVTGGNTTPIKGDRNTTMEAAGSDGPSHAPKPSRIPSHIFNPTSETSPGDWSVASNDSLFSIHMGNTSFNDRLSLMSKSGELDPTMISSPLFEFPIPPPTRKASESGSMKEEDEDGYAAAETMREVLRENESKQINHSAKGSDLSRCMSQLSDTSVKSFAFPILTAEADKNDASKKHSKSKNSSRPATASTTPQNTPPETPKPPKSPETPKAETPKPSTPKATQNGGPRRWFSCFSCFPSCS